MPKELRETWFELGEELSRYKVIEDFDESTGRPRMKIQGVCQKAETLNRNGRLYPKLVLEKAVDNLGKRINVGRGFGELDHPLMKPLLQKTSHLINKVWWDDKDRDLLCCEVTILDTPQGQILKEIVRAGGKPGFSSRGMGDTERAKVGESEVDKVKDGFDLQSFDFVIDPSVEAAQITRIMESAVSKTLHEEDKMNQGEIKTSDDLRKAYPELVKEIEDKVLEDAEKVLEQEKAEQEKGGEPKPEDKKASLEAKIADLEAQLEAARKELEGLKAENTKVAQDLKAKEEDIERYSGVVSELVKRLAEKGFIVLKADEEKKEEKQEEKTDVELLKQTLKTVEDENKKLKEDVAKETTEKQKLQEEVDSVKVERFITEELKGNKFETILRKRLEGSKSIDEVKARLAEDKNLISSLEENFGGKLPVGKGKAFEEGATADEAEKKDIREHAKRTAGIGGKK